MEVGEALCAGPSRWLRAPSCSFSFSNGGNGPKGALNGELGFQEQLWQRQDTCDCVYEMRGLHHLFIVVECRFRVRVCCLGFFPPFHHYFIFFLPFWSFLLFFGRILDIFRGKEGFMAFWRHFKPFGGFLDGFMGFFMEIW